MARGHGPSHRPGGDVAEELQDSGEGPGLVLLACQIHGGPDSQSEDGGCGRLGLEGIV